VPSGTIGAAYERSEHVIVVLVFRPEATEVQPNPFDGIEVYGIYMDAEYKQVMVMVEDLADKNPEWRIHVSPNEKLKVGFNVADANVPKPSGSWKK
jgi:hypothetical protein